MGVTPSQAQREMHEKVEAVKKLYSYMPHTWWVWGVKKLECCKVCGIVRRKDGRPDSSCKGPVSVRLRKC